MTGQCKFGMGNYLFNPSAGDTCVSAMRGVKLSDLQNHRLQRKRTKYSIVRLNWEGRICTVWMKADTGERDNRHDSPASPVSCRQHVRKVLYGKSGDLVASMNMPRKAVEYMVAASISPKGETNRKAPQGVREAHSTLAKKSITSVEGGSLTACMPVSDGGGLHSFSGTWGGKRT